MGNGCKNVHGSLADTGNETFFTNTSATRKQKQSTRRDGRRGVTPRHAAFVFGVAFAFVFVRMRRVRLLIS